MLSNERSLFVLVGSSSWDILASSSLELSEGVDYPGKVLCGVGGVIFNVASHIAAKGINKTELLLFSSIGTDIESVKIAEKIETISISKEYLVKVDGPSDKFVGIEKPDGTIFSAISDFKCTKRGENELIQKVLGNKSIKKKDREKIIILDGNLSEKSILKLLEEPYFTGTSFNLISVSSTKAEKLRKILSFTKENKKKLCLYVNITEAESFAGKSFKSPKDATDFFLNIGVSEIIITDGSDFSCSAKLYGDKILYNEYKPKHLIISSTLGAGDVFAAEHIYAKTVHRRLNDLDKLIKASEAATNFLIKKNKK